MGRQMGEVRFAQATRAPWRQAYEKLPNQSEGWSERYWPGPRPTSCAWRCSTRSSTDAAAIHPAHLAGALALFDYAARSARFAFGEESGDPLAEQIHAALSRVSADSPGPRFATCSPQPPCRCRR